jgi:hypothetical protein
LNSRNPSPFAFEEDNNAAATPSLAKYVYLWGGAQIARHEKKAEVRSKIG